VSSYSSGAKDGNVQRQAVCAINTISAADSRNEQGEFKKKVIVVFDKHFSNFGPNRFIRTYQLMNRKLADIKHR